MKMKYAFVLIAAVSILIYSNSLNNAFQYDDQIYLEENSNIKTIGLPDIFLNPSSLFAPNTATGHYRPVVLLMHVVNYRVHGLNPWGYHAVNLAFHVGSAMVLFLIIMAMLGSSNQVARIGSSEQVAGSRRNEAESGGSNGFKGLPATRYPLPATFLALTTALIFAVHPFNSEVVNYITARSSVMSGFFYLLAFYCWVKYRKVANVGSSEQVAGSRRNEAESGGSNGFKDLPATRYPLPATFYVVSLLAFLLGMLSKEVVITLPIVLWLYDLYFVHSKIPTTGLGNPVYRRDRRDIHVPLISWRTYLPYLPFVLVVVVPMMIMRIIYWGGVTPSFKRPLMVQLYTELPVLVKHLRLFIFPVGLNVDHYSEIYRSFFEWPVAVSAFILLLYLLLAVAAYRARSAEWRVVSFFMIWFFIVLLPTIVIPLNAIFQENRGYLAIIVFAVFAGVMLNKLKIPASVVILILLVLSYGAGTVYRNSVWRNGISLWSDAVAKSPESSLAHTNLGTEYAQQGKNEKATGHFLKALRFSDPEARAHIANIHYNLGAVYQQRGRDDMAMSEYKLVAENSPSDFRPHYNLGVIFQQKGEMDAAVEAYRAAIARNPSDFRSYHNLGLLFQGRGELSLAEEYYRKALSLNPDYSRSRFNLAVVYEETGRIDTARREYITVIKQNPDYVPAYLNLGLIYESEGKYEIAVRYYRKIAERNPTDSDIHARIRKIEMRMNSR